MGADTMNDDQQDDLFDAELRRRLRRDAEPDDAGFSLRVMAALPLPAAPRRHVRLLRRMQWVAISLAACGAASLLASPVDTAHTLAGAALLALLIFWTVPNRWSRG
jgi:hypothetical protein